MSNYNPPKRFTLEQANAMLPLVRAITSDLATLTREVMERRQRLAHLTSGRELAQGDPYGDELSQVERELQQDTQRLREYAAELKDLGIELKDPLTGLIDFPHEMDGQLVYLCWKLDEPEVLHWHHLDAGFAGRQPLTADVADSPDSPKDAADGA